MAKMGNNGMIATLRLRDSADSPSPPATLWDRSRLAMLMAGAAVAYLWGITGNGDANPFYAAAVWAGSNDGKALLFGSLDPGNFITVDKPPLSLWLMGLSGRIFGVGSASMLVPEARMGVASVALLYAMVTRVTSSRKAGLLAGTTLAATPVAALMFRYNNPDAAMALLMTIAAYCLVRALPRASMMWLIWAGTALGFAFLAKMLEGLLVLPAVALVYLIAAPTTVRGRLLHISAAAAALAVSSGWYVLLTILWPASSRPYLAGSTDNTFLNLVLGYNGVDRMRISRHGLTAHSNTEHGERISSASSSMKPGLTRLFHGELGFEISWLLPAALLSLVLIVVSRGRVPRTDGVRAAALLFGLWLLTAGLVLSYLNHMLPYYTLSIAPGIAGLIGLGTRELWRCRDKAMGRWGLVALILVEGSWGFRLLHLNSDWFPWLRPLILAATILTALTLVPAIRWRQHAAGLVLTIGTVAGLGGSATYTLATLSQPHTDNLRVGPADLERLGIPPMTDGDGAHRLATLLRQTTTTWSAATDRSYVAANLELSTGTAVMAIGGYTGSDPTPSLAQFQNYIATRRVSYYLSWTLDPRYTGGVIQLPRPELAEWVSEHYQPIHLGCIGPLDQVTIYDLSHPRH
jgi:4-amino-4-deoxy-L-arabinose transferase-like glycosyltransferase